MTKSVSGSAELRSRSQSWSDGYRQIPTGIRTVRRADGCVVRLPLEPLGPVSGVSKAGIFTSLPIIFRAFVITRSLWRCFRDQRRCEYDAYR